MRRLFPSLLPFVAFCTLLACGEAEKPKELARLGTACTAAADCGSHLCLHGSCTRGCVVQGDCPEGFDCGVVDPADGFGLCYKANWTNPPAGGYGTDCSASAGGCGAPNPCATGFTCHHGVKCDAKAYCSKGCAVDADCPPTFFCGIDGKDSPRECLKRTACEPCGTDDQCPANHVCAQLPSGEHYCAKTCQLPGDCLKPNKDSNTGDYLGAPFVVCSDEPGGKGKVCAPGHGVCHGPSPLPGISGDGQVCSPCRDGHPEDCAAEGSICFVDQSGEHFCTVGCKATVERTSNGYAVTKDTCPTGSFCYFGGSQGLAQCGAGCEVGYFCTGDSNYGNTSCYPLQ